MEEGKSVSASLGIVLAAVVVGIFYYYFNGSGQPSASEGTLIQGPKVEYYGC